MASKSDVSGNHVPDVTLDIPLVICITRLVAQKGLHLITHAIKHVEELVSLSVPFLYEKFHADDFSLSSSLD